MDRLRIRPITLKEANDFVVRLHRHHGATQGHKFAISVWRGERCHGVAITGHPIARQVDRMSTAEVLRVCTDGAPNACSMLYAASARAAAAMGYELIRTTILATETGVSLRAAGWKFSHTVKAESWDRPSRKRQRIPHLEVEKQVWIKRL